MNLSDTLQIVRLTDVGLKRDHNEDVVASDAEIGVMACSPQREGFQAEFTDFRLAPPLSRDIH